MQNGRGGAFASPASVLRIGEDFDSMGKRIVDFFRSDLGVLVLLAAARLVLHIATNGQYGFHRDELQTLDDARHLDWGFVAYPPITPFIGRLELILFGPSLIGVGVSILVFLPNVLWQMQHHFISLEFLSHLHARDLRQGRYNGFFREQLWLCVNLATAPLTLLGLSFYIVRQEGRRYRLLGWT